jgi:hypothetical protein
MEYMSQLIGYFCACGSYHDFLDKRVAANMETNMVGSPQLITFRSKRDQLWVTDHEKLLNQLLMEVALKSSLRMVYDCVTGHHGYVPVCRTPLIIHWGKADDRNCNYGHPKMADVESGKNLFCRLDCFYNVF